MEQDFNIKHWTNPCPKYNCRKETCKCGLKFVSIPAVLGDDSVNNDVAPKNGLYCNTIVRYEANGNVYLYSKEGIPTLVSNDSCECKGNLVIELPNGITEYGRGEAPISYNEVKEAFEQGRSIFFLDKTLGAEYAIYAVTAFDNTDGVRSIKVEKVGINPYIDGQVGFWLIQSDHSDSWEDTIFIPAIPNRIIRLEIINADTANWIIPDTNGEFGMAWSKGDIISDNLMFRDDAGNNLTIEALYNRLENGEQFLLNIASFSEFAMDESIWASRDSMGASKVIIGKNKTIGMAVESGQNFNVEFYYGSANVLIRPSVGEEPLVLSTVPVGIGKIKDQYIFTTYIYGYDFN